MTYKSYIYKGNDHSTITILQANTTIFNIDCAFKIEHLFENEHYKMCYSFETQNVLKSFKQIEIFSLTKTLKIL